MGDGCVRVQETAIHLMKQSVRTNMKSGWCLMSRGRNGKEDGCCAGSVRGAGVGLA